MYVSDILVRPNIAAKLLAKQQAIAIKSINIEEKEVVEHEIKEIKDFDKK